MRLYTFYLMSLLLLQNLFSVDDALASAHLGRLRNAAMSGVFTFTRDYIFPRCRSSYPAGAVEAIERAAETTTNDLPAAKVEHIEMFGLEEAMLVEFQDAMFVKHQLQAIRQFKASQRTGHHDSGCSLPGLTNPTDEELAAANRRLKAAEAALESAIEEAN